MLLFFGGKLLPRFGSFLGGASRKPFRQAQWMWSWATGSEDDALLAEREYGRECAREFAAQFPGRVAGGHRDLAAAVGGRLAGSVTDPRRQFHFTVLASEECNAFALPGGFVFVTVPLIEQCSGDADEMAFFLGHEMGHILLGHAREQLTAGAFLNAITARLPGAGAMLRKAMNQGYSRQLELEADREGVRLAGLAGFDRRAAVRALGRIASAGGGFFASHPPSAERIAGLEKLTGV